MTSGAGGIDSTVREPAAPPTDLPMADICAGLAIALVDDAGHIREWSPGCEAVYGWSRAEAIGAVKHDLLRSSLSAPAAPWPAAAGGVTRALAETCRDGRTIRVLEQVIPLTAAGSHALCITCDPAIDDRWAADSRRIAIAREMNAIGTVGDDVATRRFDWSEQGRLHGIRGGSLSFEKIAQGAWGDASETIVAACFKAARDGSGQLELELPIEAAVIGHRTLRFRAQLVRDANETSIGSSG